MTPNYEGQDPVTLQWKPGWTPAGFSRWRWFWEVYGFRVRVAFIVFCWVAGFALAILRGFLP